MEALLDENEDSDEEFDEDEESQVAPVVAEEDNHWLMQSVKRIRRSIGDLFGSPSTKLDDDVEEHTKKLQRRKGKGKKGHGKGKKNSSNRTKADNEARKVKKEERRKEKQEQKLHKEKQLAAAHKPVSRIRRQHVISHDDEDLADGSGSGSFDVANKQCG